MRELAIVTLPALDIVGIEHTGPYAGLGQAFERLFAWAAARDTLRPGTRFFGVAWDNPDRVPADQLRSLAGMTLPEGVTPDNGVTRLTLAGGRHAQLVHQGPYDSLGESYRLLFATLREPRADAPCFEEYLNDCRTTPPEEWLTRISVPLR
jgi:AraC family transcriptional regulator